MIRVVKSLYEPFTGTSIIIYIDMFYTSMDLLREQYYMLLFGMGTFYGEYYPKGN